MDPAGKPNGSICLRLEWKLLYMPPEDFRHQASADWEQQRRSLELQIEEEKAELRSRVCKVSVKGRTWLPRFAAPLAVAEQAGQ